MTPANVHNSRLGEALIQGDEQGYFADRAYDSQALRDTLERRGLVDGIAWKVKHARYPLEPWQQAPQRLGDQHPLSRRARLRHDEALVRNEPRPLPRACAQRLPSAARRHGHEHEGRRDKSSFVIRLRPKPFPPDRPASESKLL